MSDPICLARTTNGSFSYLWPQMANRHGLITGATGTGKTVSLQMLAERFVSIGVPVFVADVKGDLSGMAAAGTVSPKMAKRLEALNLQNFQPFANTVELWDVLGQTGTPLRATVSDLGPLLLSRLLSLNETQSGILSMMFRIADDNGLLLLDLKDLRAMAQYVGEQARELRTSYGNISTASVGAIQRGLLNLESEGGDVFFGEPALDLRDLLSQDSNGRGIVNILAADKLVLLPRLYAAVLLWLLSELYENLPEAGDLDKPKLAIFFDEAHLMFDDAPDALLTKVEQVVRLIRSKGVSVWFVTQNPADIPEKIAAQLGNRIQHALRAFTPREQKAVQVAAETMRPNPAFDAAEAISELGVGEALVSCLDDSGRPSMVERAMILPPASRLGVLTPEERQTLIDTSSLKAVYGKAVDRHSAFEVLHPDECGAEENDAAQDVSTDGVALLPPSVSGRRVGGSFRAPITPEAETLPRRMPTERAEPAAQEEGFWGGVSNLLFGSTGPRGGKREGVVESAAKSAARGVAGTMGRELGRQILRGVLGSVLGKK